MSNSLVYKTFEYNFHNRMNHKIVDKYLHIDEIDNIQPYGNVIKIFLKKGSFVEAFEIRFGEKNEH